MVFQVRIRLRHRGCVSEKVVGGARVVHMSGDGTHCISVFKADSAEQLEELLGGSAHFLVPGGIIDQAVDWVLARCACPRRGSRIIPILRDHGCTVLWPVVEADGHETYTFLVPSRLRLREVVERLRDEGDVTVERAVEVRGDALDVAVPLADLTRDLTRRQLDVLKRAVQAGYYDAPRAVLAEELAQAMGLSRSTFQEHLRKAEAVALRHFVHLVLEHPALDAQATKGPGRPTQTTE